MTDQQNDGGRKWWGATPPQMLRDEVHALARKHHNTTRWTMYELLREALAARQAKDGSVGDIVRVSTALDRKTFDQFTELVNWRNAKSADAFLRGLIKRAVREAQEARAAWEAREAAKQADAAA